MVWNVTPVMAGLTVWINTVYVSASLQMLLGARPAHRPEVGGLSPLFRFVDVNVSVNFSFCPYDVRVCINTGIYWLDPKPELRCDARALLRPGANP